MPHLNCGSLRPNRKKLVEGRNAQYLLLKAPPASVKSSALTYIALDKLKKRY